MIFVCREENVNCVCMDVIELEAMGMEDTVKVTAKRIVEI